MNTPKHSEAAEQERPRSRDAKAPGAADCCRLDEMRRVYPSFDQLVDKKLLRQLVPFHPVHIARLERAGQFPRRIQIGPSRVAWSLIEVLSWIDAKKAGRKWSRPGTAHDPNV